MTIFKLKLTKEQKLRGEKPHLVMMCNGPDCTEQERFAYTSSDDGLSRWISRHGWRSVNKGHDRWHHLCPICDRLTKLSPRDIERLIA